MRVLLMSFFWLNLLAGSIVEANEEKMTEPVYKVLRQKEWSELISTGSFAGSPDDLRDGFIHLSKASQIERVIKKYFSQSRPIYIIKFSNQNFLNKLVLEPASNGDSYPHLYDGPLLYTDVETYQVINTFEGTN